MMRFKTFIRSRRTRFKRVTALLLALSLCMGTGISDVSAAGSVKVIPDASEDVKVIPDESTSYAEHTHEHDGEGDISLYSLDTQSESGQAKQIKLDGDRTLEMDKYLSDVTGSANGQDTYDIYLEQGVIDLSVPEISTEKAPPEQNIIFVVDQSSSMYNAETVIGTNEALAAFLDNVLAINQQRIALAQKGYYVDIDPRGDVKSQLGNHFMTISGVIGYNRQVFDRYRNIDGYPVTTQAERDFIYEKCRLQLEMSLAEGMDGKLFPGTDTGSGMRRAYEWCRQQPDKENTFVLLLTDGCPTNVNEIRGNNDLHINGVEYDMCSTSTNTALSNARLIKDMGCTIDVAYIHFMHDIDVVMKAYDTGDIRSLSMNTLGGSFAIFLGLLSSDYPKNGLFGTVSGATTFSGTYSFEADTGNRFGVHTSITTNMDELFTTLVSKPYAISGGSMETMGYASASSVVKDELSAPFDVQPGRDVTVYKVPRVPVNLDANGVPTDMDMKTGVVQEFRWGLESYIENDTLYSEWTDITDQVSVSIKGQSIQITGFDYESNAAVTYDKDMVSAWRMDDAAVYHEGDYGYKLVVKVPIQAKYSFGGNHIATNNESGSAFYPSTPGNPNLPVWPQNAQLNPGGTDYIARYPVPYVDLAVNYDLVCDNAVVYAPQTMELFNLGTDENNNLWYQDVLWESFSVALQNAMNEYNDILDARNEYEQELLGTVNVTAAQLAKMQEYEDAVIKALTACQDAQEELSKLDNFTPDGINNQFVDISYKMMDPDGNTVMTMTIPHGKAYTGSNINWQMVSGVNKDIQKSGTYTIAATVTPVNTTASPSGRVYSALDSSEIADACGYSSEQYSSTGSSASGSSSAKTFTKNPTAYLYQLHVTVRDTRLSPRQTIDFIQGLEPLEKTQNPHLVEYKWVCTDGKTLSVKANEPGVTGSLFVGGGVKINSSIPSAAFTDGLAQVINSITACGDESGSYIPVATVLSRPCGNLNKNVSTVTAVQQTERYLSASDNVFGTGLSSVVWEHECDIVDECATTDFADSKRYGDTDNGTGIGVIRYLIHIEDNPKPEVHKTTSTPTISKGETIRWQVVVSNTSEGENPEHLKSDFSLVDVLPWVGDERVDPNTGYEGSQYGGSLVYSGISFDLSKSETTKAVLASGDGAVYYTTDVSVRTADESQILGEHSSGNVAWVKAKTQLDGNTLTITDLPADAIAFKLVTRLAFGEKVTASMTGCVTESAMQENGDRYHNQAWVYNGNGGRDSEVVATTVTALSISGKVWDDFDNNGLIGADEEGIPDVVLTLYKAWEPKNGGTPDRVIGGVKLQRVYTNEYDRVPQAITDASGNYVFEDIQNGTYYIVADTIPEQYSPTKKGAAGSDDGAALLDSECAESFVDGTDEKLDKTAWIVGCVVQDDNTAGQNFGLQRIRGNIKVWKSLDEIYYPSSMTDEEREDYQLVFLFKLENTDTHEIYKQTVRLTSETYCLKNGSPQVYCEFKDLPLGTYTLSEAESAQYKLSKITSGDKGAVWNASKGTMTVSVTPDEHEFEVHAQNLLDKDPPGGDENGVKNWVNVRVPIRLDIIYVGPDPISDHTLTKYTFTEADFDPKKGGDMIVTYDDGTQISLSAGTLKFTDVVLSPGTVTNAMNSGDRKVSISGYYSEKGRVVSDSFKVAVDLKPVHKFQLTFDANGSKFDDNATRNVVHFAYDDNTGHNYVTSGVYKDVANGGLINYGSAYGFAGWNTKYDGSGINYDSLSALDAIGADPTISSLTLYAQWTCNVTFNANGGSITYTGNASQLSEGEKNALNKTSSSITYNVNQQMATHLAGARSSYHYVLWNTKADGSGIDLEDYGPVTGPVTFYAIYYQSDYVYIGAPQVFTAPVDGWYQIQLWGANGGVAVADYPMVAGNGAYVRTQMWFPRGAKIYVICGGNAPALTGNAAVGGYNGGGYTMTCYAGAHSGSGGGMTHISFTNNLAIASPSPTSPGTWNSSGTIAVAGGGGGGSWTQGGPNYCNVNPHAGAETSFGGYANRVGVYIPPSTQTSGWAKGCGQSCANSSGGGGGWWGGRSCGFTTQTNGGYCDMAGAGGSSHICSASEVRSWLPTFQIRNSVMYAGNDARKPANPFNDAGAAQMLLIERTN